MDQEILNELKLVNKNLERIVHLLSNSASNARPNIDVEKRRNKTGGHIKQEVEAMILKARQKAEAQVAKAQSTMRITDVE